ncbi:MAG TPA: DMT family transporter [Magnetospirillaceae bacterium]
MLGSDLLAILSAICIATSGMLVSELNGRVDIVRFARWNMIAAMLMTGAGSLILGGWRTIEGWQLGLLAGSSFAGIIIASTTYFSAIYMAGPRMTALLFSLASPFAVALGYFVLGETISMRQGLGIAIILTGIVLAVGAARGRREPTADATKPPRQFWIGIALGVITALGQAAGGLLARPAMAAGVEPFTAMAIRSGIAAVFYIALGLSPIAWAKQPYRFKWRDLSVGVGASFFGTGLGMTLLMAALADGDVGIVSTLSSMTPIAILPMVWIRTRTAPRPLAWIGAGLAVVGTALLSIP